MELKVWVEGIQRVICGVTESTTCQDVVIALAHATGKTGRFTLVEKWRENERLLAPTENPLKVLHKWGEYAVDVTFILRHSEKSRSRHKHNDPLSRTDKFSHNFSPHQKSPGHGVGIKKSFTFSGAHTPSPQHAGKGSRSARTLPDNSSLESLDEQSSVASYSSRSSVSPYASLEKKKKHKHNHVPPLYSPVGSPERKKIPNSVDSSPVRSNGSTPPNYHEIRPKRGTPSQSCKYVNSHESSKAKTAVDIHNLHRQSPGGGSHEGSDRGEEKFRRKDFEKKVTHSDDVGRDNLIKLITLQQDRLQVQETQLKATDSEIKFWEQREKDHDQQAKILNDEIRKLQFSEREIDDELQELDLVSWVDKLEIEKQHEKMTESELTLMRSKLANCESELLQCKNKIHLLMSQIEGEKREQEQQQKEHRAQETKLQLEICDLQKEMKDKVVEYEEWQCTIDELLVELKNLDSAISEKNTDISSIEKDLKQANLDYFMTVPTLPSQDGEGGFSRLSPSRPGSARKMTSSPQRLGEAVPTTRNPHGMWV